MNTNIQNFFQKTYKRSILILYIKEKKKHMTYYIYALIDPTDGRVRYIGKTNNLKNRLKEHIGSSKKKGFWTPKNQWIKSLLDNNLTPIISPIFETTKEEVNKYEIEYIKRYRELESDLTNTADGGDGYDWTGRKHSDDTIERLKLCHPNRKAIYQFDMSNNFIRMFNSSREVDKLPNFNRRSVVRCCKNEIKSFNGYYFRFSDNFFLCELAQPITNMEEIQKILDANHVERLPTKRKQKTIDKQIKIKEEKIKNKKPQKIYIHYDLGGNILGRYVGLKNASKQTGCHEWLLSNCCKNKSYYTVNGTTFRYEGDEFDYQPYNKNIQKTSRKVSKYSLDGKFICEFDSIKRAAAELGGKYNEANISSCCHKKWNKKTGKSIIVKGFTYRFSGEEF
jgi:hypothetical protein